VFLEPSSPPVVPEIAPPGSYVIAPHDPNGSMVAGFLESCDEDDLDAADVDPDEPDLHVALAAVDGIAVGYAGFRIWERNLADVGVLVARDHRQRGLASALVASVTATALSSGLVPLYRHESSHAASAAVRAPVGYEVFWEATVLKLRA
jgi:GNAT superfamily N-acetyltransferase